MKEKSIPHHHGQHVSKTREEEYLINRTAEGPSPQIEVAAGEAKRMICKKEFVRNCHLCKCRFANSMNLNVHLENHNDMVFKCDQRYCGWTFKKFRRLRDCLLSNHDQQIPKDVGKQYRMDRNGGKLCPQGEGSDAEIKG